MKFCIDCKWSYGLPPLECKSPRASRSLVTGAVRDRACFVQRMWPWPLADMDGQCGRRGRFWEPKEDK